MRKLFLCIVLIFSLAIAPALASSSYKVMKVVVSGANIRKGPGNYDVMDMLKRDSRVLLLDKTTHAYYKIMTTKGEIGYIFRDHVVEIGSVSKKEIYKAVDKVNVRRKPSAHSGRVDKLIGGELVRVVSTENGWSQVMTLRGKTGYVMSEYLTK